MLAKARRLCYDKYRFYQKGRIEYATFFPYKRNVFPDFFCRIHRSYLINCHHVSKVERYYVMLVTGETLPIPEKRYTEVYHNVMRAMK